jgi:transcription-repair coupling factor (superfamily II helicase)
VASHDLELRGAGDLLGGKQSGQIAAIGFEMYTELLEETIHELQGMAAEEKIDPEIRLGLSAFLPEKYVSDPNQRLVLYKKMASAQEEEELYLIADELRDRYGEIPDAAAVLLESMKLRLVMKRLRVALAEYVGTRIVFAFDAATTVAPERIMGLLKEPDRYAFTPDYRLSVKVGRIDPATALATARKELQAFL